MNTEIAHSAWVRPFLNRAVRATFTDVDPGTKSRIKLLNRLCHDYETTLDWRIAQPLSTAEQTVERIGSMLQQRGAERTCYVLCMPEQWDGRQLPLTEALEHLMGNGLPVLLVCRAESLAYFEPEYTSGDGRRFILYRQST